MGSLSIWHWVISLFVIWAIFASVISIAKILRRMGYSGWWSLLFFVWPISAVGLVKLAKASWPALKQD